jgi:uncharacterized integral membrane protein
MKLQGNNKGLVNCENTSGHNDAHHNYINDITERLKNIEKDVKSIKKRISLSSRKARYRFQFNIGYAGIGIGIAMMFAPDNKPVGPLLIKSWGEIVVFLGFAIMIASRLDLLPKRFNIRLILAGLGALVTGVILIVLINNNLILIHPIVALLTLVVGAILMVILFFQKILRKLKRVRQVDTDSHKAM